MFHVFTEFVLQIRRLRFLVPHVLEYYVFVNGSHRSILVGLGQPLIQDVLLCCLEFLHSFTSLIQRLVSTHLSFLHAVTVHSDVHTVRLQGFHPDRVFQELFAVHLVVFQLLLLHCPGSLSLITFLLLLFPLLLLSLFPVPGSHFSVFAFQIRFVPFLLPPFLFLPVFFLHPLATLLEGFQLVIGIVALTSLFITFPLVFLPGLRSLRSSLFAFLLFSPGDGCLCPFVEC